MKVSEAVDSRRSIKRYDPHHIIPEEVVRRLLERALLAPTAYNVQHWRIVRVQDPALRRQLQAAAWEQAQVTEASLLLVICMDLRAWDRNPERYWHQAPTDARQRLAHSIRSFYDGNTQLQRDEGMRSCAMLTMTLMLLARELGYDTCPMDGFDFNLAAQLINLPADHEICMMLTLGKRLQPARPRGGQLKLEEVVVVDGFGDSE